MDKKVERRIVVISGPSGVGKGSINSVLLKNKNLALQYSISMTTRKPRNGEVNGVNYFFVSEPEFEDAMNNNELIECAKFVGNYYGTPRKFVQQQLRDGYNVILEIEVDGATQVIQNEENVLSIFLMPPTLQELANRLTGRQTEPTEIIKTRLDKALLEVPLKHNYQYVVENDTVENAVAKIADILAKENAVATDQPTMFERLEIMMKDIVEKNYMFFVENWEMNVQLLKDNGVISTQQFNDFDAKDNLIHALTARLYHRILAHGEFNDLLDRTFVENQVQRLMFKINFFSIEQKIE